MTILLAAVLITYGLAEIQMKWGRTSRTAAASTREPMPLLASSFNTSTYDTPPPAPAMTLAPSGADGATYLKAVAQSETAHHTRWNLTLIDPSGHRLGDAQVKFSVQTPQFIFGTTAPTSDAEYRLIKDAGFDGLTYQVSWATSQPTPADFRGVGPQELAEMQRYHADGMHIMAHSLLWLPPPGYDQVPKLYQDLPFDQFVAAYQDHIYKLAKSLEGKADLFDIANEPMTNWANAMNLDQSQWQRLVDAGSRAVHAATPHAWAMVNSYGVKSDGVQHHPTKSMEPLDFFTSLIAKKIPFDISGIEDYYNNVWGQTGAAWGQQPYVYDNPPMSLTDLSNWLDRYSKLGKPIFLTEFQANGSSYPGHRSSFWGRTWGPSLQADYVQAVLTTMYSRDDVEGMTYWDTPYPVFDGMLFNADGTPRDALARIKGLIKHWSTSGRAVTSATGGFSLSGVGALYRFDVPASHTHPAYVGWGYASGAALQNGYIQLQKS